MKTVAPLVLLASAHTIALLSLLLTGCSNVPFPSVPQSVIGSGAFIRGEKREKTIYHPIAIDGALVLTARFLRAPRSTVPIGPGERLVLVQYREESHFWNPPTFALATIKVKIEAGISYVIGARSEGDVVHFWISRSDTGKKVTEEVLALKTNASRKPVVGTGAFFRGVNREKTAIDYDAFYLRAVDGASVKWTIFTNYEKPVPISPGERFVIMAYVGNHGSRLLLRRFAEATVKVNIEAGGTYVVDGRCEGDIVYFWMSRADTGQKVTEEVLASKIDEGLDLTIIPLPILK